MSTIQPIQMHAGSSQEEVSLLCWSSWTICRGSKTISLQNGTDDAREWQKVVWSKTRLESPLHQNLFKIFDLQNNITKRRDVKNSASVTMLWNKCILWHDAWKLEWRSQMRHPLLGNGLVNTFLLQWIHTQYKNCLKWCFLCGPC
jgi:hypothetical protein